MMCRRGSAMMCCGSMWVMMWLMLMVMVVVGGSQTRVVESAERGAGDSKGVVGAGRCRQRRHTHELKGAQMQTRTRNRARSRARARSMVVVVVVVVVITVVDHELEHGAERSDGRGQGTARVEHLS